MDGIIVSPSHGTASGAAVLTRLSQGADLMVVGRRSVSGLERMFIGSTSIAVASGAHCPVVVISNAANPDYTGGKHRTAVAVDAHSHSPSTLEWAFANAVARDSSLTVIHVAKPVQTTVAGDQLHDATGRRVLAVNELVGLSERVDLLVLGVPKPRMLGFGMGGVMRAVMAHARCPVALVK